MNETTSWYGKRCPRCKENSIRLASQWTGSRWMKILQCPGCGFEPEELDPPLSPDNNPDAFKIGEMGEPEVTPKIHEFIKELEKP